jgi:hypothetical protein
MNIADQKNSNTNSVNIHKATNEFKDQVEKYVSENKPKLYILTPCFGSICFINYVDCLVKTIELFKNFNFPLQIEFCKNDSLVCRARNNLIARACADENTTHILFIDNDITWNPVDIMRLILANKPIIGAAYPIKDYKWDKLLNPETGSYNPQVIAGWMNKKNENAILKNMISDKSMIQANLLRYNINYLNNVLSIENNIAKVKHLATGFMLIQRNVIDKMMKAFPSTKYVDDVNFLKEHENKYAHALFDCGVEDGHYLSEDWMFCQRWGKMGGEIWLDVTVNLVHTGIEDYKGSFVSSII